VLPQPSSMFAEAGVLMISLPLIFEWGYGGQMSAADELAKKARPTALTYHLRLVGIRAYCRANLVGESA
jgi:hypothetical protein